MCFFRKVFFFFFYCIKNILRCCECRGGGGGRRCGAIFKQLIWGQFVQKNIHLVSNCVFNIHDKKFLLQSDRDRWFSIIFSNYPSQIKLNPITGLHSSEIKLIDLQSQTLQLTVPLIFPLLSSEVLANCRHHFVVFLLYSFWNYGEQQINRGSECSRTERLVLLNLPLQTRGSAPLFWERWVNSASDVH